MYIGNTSSMLPPTLSGIPKSFLPKKQAATPAASQLDEVEAQGKNDVLYGVDMGSNMMAGNFVNTNRQPSKYVQAQIDGMQQLRDMRVRQSASPPYWTQVCWQGQLLRGTVPDMRSAFLKGKKPPASLKMKNPRL